MQIPQKTPKIHRSVIVLACLALMVLMMQGVSWFSLSRQQQISSQAAELSKTLASQVAFTLQPLMKENHIDSKTIDQQLEILTTNSRILDASVYDLQGNQIAQRGQSISVRDRLSLDGGRAGSYFNRQLVETIGSDQRPQGFLRLTFDTHLLPTESKQVDNTTNLLRLMLLLALAIGIILTRTLLREQRTHWQQSPFLLTANKPIEKSPPAPLAPNGPAAVKKTARAANNRKPSTGATHQETKGKNTQAGKNAQRRGKSKSK